MQARGTLQFREDGAWLVRQGAPWSLQDASPEFVQEAAQRLIGFEIEITELTGKRFLSQQRTEADRRSVVHHLGLEPSGAARDVATLVQI